MNAKRNYQNSHNPNFTGVEQLNVTEQFLSRYSRNIVKLIIKGLQVSNIREGHDYSLLEFGAGTGFLADLLKEDFGLKPDCVELDPNLQQLITSKGFICEQHIADLNRKYDAVYTSNVLEHILDDLGALVELHGVLKPRGVMVVYVPAHPFLFSKMDEEIGHVRRYTKRELQRKVETAGFTIQAVNYDDFLGYFISMIVRFAGYGKKGIGSPQSLRIYDNLIFPISRFFDLVGMRFVIGKNLYLVATKSPIEK
jgi:SAM-dependent methyltransferase